MKAIFANPTVVPCVADAVCNASRGIGSVSYLHLSTLDLHRHTTIITSIQKRPLGSGCLKSGGMGMSGCSSGGEEHEART